MKVFPERDGNLGLYNNVYGALAIVRMEVFPERDGNSALCIMYLALYVGRPNGALP